MEPRTGEAKDTYIEEVLEDGTKVERRIDKVSSSNKDVLARH